MKYSFRIAFVFLLTLALVPASPAGAQRRKSAEPKRSAKKAPAPAKKKGAQAKTSKSTQKKPVKSTSRKSASASSKKSSRSSKTDPRASKRSRRRDSRASSKRSRRDERAARSARRSPTRARAATARETRRESGWELGYTVRIADPASRAVKIDARLELDEPTGAIDLFLTDVDGHYTPGYAQFVDSVKLTAPDGTPVELSHPTINRWRPARVLAPGAYRLEYTVRIDHASKPSAWGLKETPQLDATGGVMLGAALFMFPAAQGDSTALTTAPPKLSSARIDVSWTLPAGWRALGPWRKASSTSMRPSSIDDLLDNFLVVGPPSAYDTFETRLGDRIVTAVVRRGAWRFTSAQLWQALEPSIAQAFMVFGDLPSPSYLLVVNPWPGTRAQSDTTTGGGAARQSFHAMLDEKFTAADLSTVNPLATLVHETFHWWNPAGLPPATPTDFYWWHEGVSVYYGYLLAWRSGAISRDTFLAAMLESYDRGERNNAVRPRTSLVEASRRIAADGGAEYDAVYHLGAVVAFRLDLEIRRRSGGANSLDDLLRALYERHRRTKQGFTLDDMADEASVLAGAPMREFFARYVEGHERFDWDATLAAIGYREIARPTGRAFIGVTFEPDASAPTIRSVHASGPAAGRLAAGDVVMAVDASAIGSLADFSREFASRKPGARVELRVLRGGVETRVELVLGERKDIATVPATPQPPEARALLDALGSRPSATAPAA